MPPWLRSSSGLLLLLLMSLHLIVAWNEDDENRRIIAIKEREEKQFEYEQWKQNSARGKSRGSYLSDYGDAKTVTGEYYGDRKWEGRRSMSSRQPEPEERFAEPPTSDALKMDDTFWCYHCASQLSKVSPEMRAAIRKFMEVRRSSFESEVVMPDCVNPRNTSSLPRQTCKHSLCETIAFVDHNEGASFVLRGCAENFGGINAVQMKNKPSSFCTKLHPNLDATECICKDVHYCHARKAGANTKHLLYLISSVVLVLFLQQII